MVVPRLAVPVGTAARSGHPVRLGVSDGPGGRCVFLRAGLPGDQVQLSARRQTQGQVVFPPAETLACLSHPCAIRRARSEDGQRHRSEEHTSELQSQSNLVCRLLLEKKKTQITQHYIYT